MPCSDHAVLLKVTARRPCCAVALRRTAWSEHGMASVNQTRPHCVNQMEKTHSKPLVARHGKGTAWSRHAMCESALSLRCVTCHGIEDAIPIQQPSSLNQDIINFNKKREHGRRSKLVISWTLTTELSHVTVPFQSSTGMVTLIM